MNKPAQIDRELAIPVGDDVAEVARPAKRSWWRWPLMLGVPVLLLAIGAYFWATSGKVVTTDNATVDAPVASIAPQVSGQIVEVAVSENRIVRPGDLLFRIDPAPYRIALMQADAAVAAARVQMSQLASSADARTADIGAKAAAIGARQSDVALARETFARQAALMARGFTTRAQYDAARAAVVAAEQAQVAAAAEREAAAATATAAHAAVDASADGVQPAIAQAQAQRAKALLDLSRTEVHAPRGGRVTQADRLQVGNMATQSLPIVSVVGDDSYWIDANFKETQLATLRIGQPAQVEIDALPGRLFTAHVSGIGAGTGAQFSLLPSQNAGGNWVKVTQRVPVRLTFDQPPGSGLVAGWSAKVKVRVAQ